MFLRFWEVTPWLALYECCTRVPVTLLLAFFKSDEPPVHELLFTARPDANVLSGALIASYSRI